MADQADILSWLHVGDLHITRPLERNHRDLLCLGALLRGLPPDAVDFALLPGDSAEDGTEAQFALVREALADLPMPLHILPGDHDFKPGTLEAFHDRLGAARLPMASVVRGHRCLFLDVVSAGTGGPDFRLDAATLDWVAREIDAAARAGQTVGVFMHSYPADLRQGGDRLRALLARPHVACVDMGHTHYNELGNDGRTIFMATRSTGQVEEGPPGFSVAAIDGGRVGWRFKTLDEAWPLVLITSPVDCRLAPDADRAASGPLAVRARAIGDVPVVEAELRVDGDDWVRMTPMAEAACTWQAAVRRGERVTVRVRDAAGRTDEDVVEPLVAGWIPPGRHGDGSDADRLDPWPERHILGTQLGPNRNGRQW